MAKRRDIRSDGKIVKLLRDDEMECGYCDEPVKKSAWRCRACKRWFSEGKRAIALLVVLVLVAATAPPYYVFIVSGDKKSVPQETQNEGKPYQPPEQSPSSNRVATVVVKDFGTIKISLAEDKAPKTTKNFIELANRGFYNGLTFHRIVANFVIQGGDPNGDGTGGSGENIAWENTGLLNVKYSVAMARGTSPDSASSQFYVNLNDNTNLDAAPYPYVVFGQVISGTDVVDAIGRVPTSGETPLDPPVMTSVTIGTT